jgi:hypothetical protein
MDILSILAELYGQRDRITQAIEALESLNNSTLPTTKAPTTAAIETVKPATVAPVATTKRVISPEARRRMADAQKKRYAKARKSAAVIPAKKEAPKKSANVGMTAAGRKRLFEV